MAKLRVEEPALPFFVLKITMPEKGNATFYSTGRPIISKSR